MAKIETLVILESNPEESESRYLRNIFYDDLARTLWLALRQGDMNDDIYFDSFILAIAAKIKEAKKKGKLTAKWLADVLIESQVVKSIDGEFAQELLLFVLDEKAIGYEVRKAVIPYDPEIAEIYDYRAKRSSPI